MKVYVTRQSGMPLLPEKLKEYQTLYKSHWDKLYKKMYDKLDKLPKPKKIPWYRKLFNKVSKKQVALVDLTDIAHRKARREGFKKFQKDMNLFEKQLNKKFRSEFEVEMDHTEIDELLKEFPGQAAIGLDKTKKALILILNG